MKSNSNRSPSPPDDPYPAPTEQLSASHITIERVEIALREKLGK